MVSPLCCLLAAAALCCWPRPAASSRLLGLAPRDDRARWRPATPRRPRPATAVALTAAAGTCVGWLAAGVGGAIGLGTLAATASWRLWSRRGESASLSAAADLAAALGLLTAELRAGVHPAVAARRVAGDAGPVVAGVLDAIADATRLSGDVPGALHAVAARANAAGLTGLAGPLGRLAGAWRLSERHGVGLADVLDAARRDLDHRVRSARRLAASLAGPKATSAVLAMLPLLGLLLGQAVGAAPWRMLAGTDAGQVLLAVGCGLLSLGVAWSARIVTRAAAP